MRSITMSWSSSTTGFGAAVRERLQVRSRRDSGLRNLGVDEGVLVDELARLGVVVVERERVSFGLLQEVDDVAILMRAADPASSCFMIPRARARTSWPLRRLRMR